MATQNLYGTHLANLLSLSLGTPGTTKIDNVSFLGCGSVALFEAGHGSINKIAYKCTAATSPPTIRFSLQSVSSRATPGGILGSGTAFVNVASMTTGFAEATLGTPYTGSVGDAIAICAEYQTGTVDASHFATLQSNSINIGNASGVPYCYQKSNASAYSAVASNLPMICPVYNDGYYGAGFWAASTVTNTSFTSASNPKYYGSKWVQGIAGTMSGCTVFARPAAGSTFTAVLHEGSATTGTTVVSTSAAFNPDVSASGTGGTFPLFIPMPAYNLVAGNTYRLVISMGSATSFTSFYGSSFWSSAAINSCYGPLYGTTGSSGTLTWTDYDGGVANDFRAYYVIPKIDSYTASGGGAGGSPILKSAIITGLGAL